MANASVVICMAGRILARSAFVLACPFLQATWTPRWRFSYTLYGNRRLTYSLLESYSHFTSDRLGLSIGSRLGRSSSVELFAETGVHDYAPSAPGVAAREDDFTSYGTSVQFQLQERVRLNLGAVRTEIASDAAGLDRSLTVFSTSVDISAFGGALTAPIRLKFARSVRSLQAEGMASFWRIEAPSLPRIRSIRSFQNSLCSG